MAVGLYKAANRPTSGNSGTSLRGLFGCCYGSKQTRSVDENDDDKVHKSGLYDIDDEAEAEWTNNESQDVEQRNLHTFRGNRNDCNERETPDYRRQRKSPSPPIRSANHAARQFSDSPIVSRANSPIFNHHALQLEENEAFGSMGSINSRSSPPMLDIVYMYDAQKQTLNITISAVKDLPMLEKSPTYRCFVKISLLPSKSQSHKTREQKSEAPVFHDIAFFTKLSHENVAQQSLQFRLYACGKLKRTRLLGEHVLPLSEINLQVEKRISIPLEIGSMLKTSLSALSLNIADDNASLLSETMGRDSKGSISSAAYSIGSGVAGAELLIGLTYNGTTGRLCTEIIKGSGFRLRNTHKPPDSFVKVKLVSANGQEITKSRTTMRRGQANPLFKEKFMFQVALFQLTDVGLLVSACYRKQMKRTGILGEFSMGVSNSSEDEQLHWQDMINAKGEEVSRWHALSQPGADE